MSRTAIFAVALALAASTFRTAEARVNATGAIDVFLITSCEECVADKNSIFCTNAKADSNYAKNATFKYTIAMKKRDYGAADGSKYCWSGTFGKLVEPIGSWDNKLGSVNVSAYLECSDQDLYYRQCILHAQLAIILMSVGAIVCVCGTTCCCFYCGCCKCCNNKGDESKWGMFNRFCPSAPCADPPEKEDALPEHVYNPQTEEENLGSLFGKNNKLNEVSKIKSSNSLADLKRPGAPLSPRSGGGSEFGTSNPLRGSAV